MKKLYGDGGSVEVGNRQMLMNQAIEFKHHAEELIKAIAKNKKIDAWVIAKAERATTDLSDITHYLEGKYKKFKWGGITKSYSKGDLIAEFNFDSFMNFVSPKVQEEAQRNGIIFDENDYAVRKTNSKVGYFPTVMFTGQGEKVDSVVLSYFDGREKLIGTIDIDLNKQEIVFRFPQWQVYGEDSTQYKLGGIVAGEKVDRMLNLAQSDDEDDVKMAKRLFDEMSVAEKKDFKRQCDEGDAADEGIYEGFIYLISQAEEEYKYGGYMAFGGRINIGTNTKTDSDVYYDRSTKSFYIHIIDGAGSRVNKLEVNSIDDVLKKFPNWKWSEAGRKEFQEAKGKMADGGEIKDLTNYIIKDNTNDRYYSRRLADGNISFNDSQDMAYMFSLEEAEDIKNKLEIQGYKDLSVETYDSDWWRKMADGGMLGSVEEIKNISNAITEETGLEKNDGPEYGFVTRLDVERILNKEKYKLLKYKGTFLKNFENVIPLFEEIISDLSTYGWKIIDTRKQKMADGGMMAKGGEINMNKVIWRDWTVADFIKRLEMKFPFEPKFSSKEEVKKWAMESQIYYKGYIPEVVDYFWKKNDEKYSDSSIELMPPDLQRDLMNTAYWGNTDIKGVIGILNAMIDLGMTDKDLEPKAAKSSSAIEKAHANKTEEIWAKIKPKYKGDFEGNQYYSTILHLVRNDSDYEILKRYKPFRKYQKDYFADGGMMANGGVLKVYKKDNQKYYWKFTFENGKEENSFDGFSTSADAQRDFQYKSKYFKMADGDIIPLESKVKVGDILTANTGVKVKVVEYDPKFGGRVKVERMDEYATGKPSVFMPLSRFKFEDGGLLDSKVSYVTESGKKLAYHDMNGELIKKGDKVKIVYNSGRNQGSPNTEIGTITKMDDFGYWTLDNGKTVKPNKEYDFTDEDGIMHFIGKEEGNGWTYTIEKIDDSRKMADGGRMAKGGEVRYKLKGVNFSQQIESGQKFKSLITKVFENQTGENKYPENFIKEIAVTEKIVKSNGSNYLKDYAYKGTLTKFEFLDDKDFIEALKYVDRPAIRKFEEGGIMAKGGATFKDKVKAISKRLEGTKVPKKLEGDYGKTYSKLESKLAAMRIAGSMRKKGY